MEMPSSNQRSWSSLPNDLLGEVYRRLPPPLGRARFAAACKSWRTAACKLRRAAAATNSSSRPLPWLMLDPCVGYRKRRFLYSPEDDVVLPRTPLRGDPARGRFVGYHDGGWVAWSEPPFGILNIFSGDEIPFSPKQKRSVRGWGDTLLFRKIIFSEEPTSRGCIIAGITENNYVAICMVGCPEGGWTIHEESTLDIAFCNGELYGLMNNYCKTLNKFEIGMDEDGIPYFKTVNWLVTMPNPLHDFPKLYDMYIVELCGNIVMAARRNQGQPPWSRNIGGSFFSVFKLADADDDGVTTHRFYKWEDMTSLDDHALFLSPTFSKAVHLLEDGHGYAQRNHIYYCHPTQNNGAKKFLRASNNNGQCDGQIYCKEDGRIDNGIEGILSVGYYVRAGLHSPMWILPLDSRLRYRVKSSPPRESSAHTVIRVHESPL